MIQPIKNISVKFVFFVIVQLFGQPSDKQRFLTFLHHYLFELTFSQLNLLFGYIIVITIIFIIFIALKFKTKYEFNNIVRFTKVYNYICNNYITRIIIRQLFEILRTFSLSLQTISAQILSVIFLSALSVLLRSLRRRFAV